MDEREAATFERSCMILMEWLAKSYGAEFVNPVTKYVGEKTKDDSDDSMAG